MEKGKEMLLCRLCSNQRFRVEAHQEYATCPRCGTEWKIKWIDGETATVISPKSWNEWWRKWA